MAFHEVFRITGRKCYYDFVFEGCSLFLHTLKKYNIQIVFFQEELAQVLEMLGLTDEALVQYDELDALFSQFVLNGHVGDTASWLGDFQRPLERWHGLKLGPYALPKRPSLLELRAYLFAKQAHMLLLSNKIWEVRKVVS